MRTKSSSVAMPRLALVAAVCLVAALVAPRLSLAQEAPARHDWYQPRLIEFDAPGAATAVSPLCGTGCGTVAYANNDWGETVGYYTDPNVVPHGFLRTANGRFISFDAPGAGLGAGLNQGTAAFAINDFGAIVGQYQDSNYVYHSFIRNWNGSFTTFDAPGAGSGANQGTLAWSINQLGDTAGSYIDKNNAYHGFVRSRSGAMTSFDPAGSVYTYVCEETCLNDSGTITGFYSDASGTFHGFVRNASGKITTFDAPGAVYFTGGASINPFGLITGYYLDANFVGHGFLRQPNGRFSTFLLTQGPTYPFSINPFGAIAGEYVDVNNMQHGFERWGNHTATFDAPGAGTGAFQGTRPSTNNADGAVVGWWIDPNGLNHGFVWTPY